MSENKTEKPTPRKRKQARKKGQVARTPELGAWASILLLSLALPLLVKREVEAMRELMAACLTAAQAAEVGKALNLLSTAGRHALVSLVIVGSVVMVIGVAGAVAQGGFYLATDMVKPKANKLNPIAGLKRIFGPQAWWQGAKMLLKTAVLGWFVYHGIRTLMPMLGGLMPFSAVLGKLSSVALGMVAGIAVGALTLAAADYAMQRRRVSKQTRMSKEEVRQEHKQTEGDPLVKSAIRSRQLAAARSRMIADVPTADVLLVNPTHVAVALRYEPERGAPRVVARGAGAIAQKVREVAAEAAVPIVRDVPLARALYRSTTVGQEIPPELFAAVAQVLAFVIGRRNQGQTGGEHTSPRGHQALPDISRTRRRPIASGLSTPGR